MPSGSALRFLALFCFASWQVAPGEQSVMNAWSQSSLGSMYHMLHKVQSKYSASLKVPRLVFVGPESAGKTSVVEFLVGYTVAAKKTGTATRCPTILTLKRNISLAQGDRRVFLRGKSVKASDLVHGVKQHMESLGGDFSNEPLEISVMARDVEDLVILDLPGLIRNPGHDTKARDNSERVERMVASYVRDPENILVVVSKCKERVSSLDEVPLIEGLAIDEKFADQGPARLTWKESAIFLVNFVNFQFKESFMDIQAANDFFEDAKQQSLSGSTQYYFVSMRPTRDRDIDKMSFSESEEYYKALPAREQNFYKEELERLESRSSPSGHAWTSEHEQYLGVDKVGPAIQLKLHQELEARLPAVKQELEALLRQRKVDLAMKEEEKEASDPKKAQEKLGDFFIEFKKHFEGSIQGEEVKGGDSQQGSPFREPVRFKYSVDKYGSTFAEEFERTPFSEHYGEWPGLLSLEELKSEEHLGHKGQQLGELLDRKLLGVAAFARVLQIYEYMLLVRNFDDVSDDEIYGMAHNSRAVSQFPSNDVVMQLATQQLQTAAEGVQWISAFLHRHFSEHATRIFDHLIHSLPFKVLPQGVKDLMEDRILSGFDSLLQRQLQSAMAQHRHLVATFDEYRPVDKMRKQLMLNLILSLKDMILPMDTLWPAATSQVPGEKPSEWSQIFARPTKQGHYASQPQEGSDPGPHERNKQKLESLRNIADHITMFHDHFNFADIVAPGLQQVAPQDWNFPNYPYLRRCAQRYYCSFIIELMESVTRIWSTEFKNYLTSKHRNDLEYDLDKLKQAILADESAWSVASGPRSTEEVAEQIKATEEEIKDIEGSLKAIQRFLRGPRHGHAQGPLARKAWPKAVAGQAEVAKAAEVEKAAEETDRRNEREEDETDSDLQKDETANSDTSEDDF